MVFVGFSDLVGSIVLVLVGSWVFWFVLQSVLRKDIIRDFLIVLSGVLSKYGRLALLKNELKIRNWYDNRAINVKLDDDETDVLVENDDECSINEFDNSRDPEYTKDWVSWLFWKIQ